MWSLDRKHQHHPASSGNLLDMQIHGPHLNLPESEILEARLGSLYCSKTQLKHRSGCLLYEVPSIGQQHPHPGTCYKCISWGFTSDLQKLHFNKTLRWFMCTSKLRSTDPGNASAPPNWFSCRDHTWSGKDTDHSSCEIIYQGLSRSNLVGSSICTSTELVSLYLTGCVPNIPSSVVIALPALLSFFSLSLSVSSNTSYT